MLVLSFDPGGTTGICLQDENKVYQSTDTRDIDDWLETYATPIASQVNMVVIEEYTILPHQQHTNTGKAARQRSLVTVEIIGAIKSWCRRHKIEFTMYDASLKPTQCKLTQIFPKKMPKNIEHKWDAFNHGRYFLIQRGLALTSLEAEMKAKGEL